MSINEDEIMASLMGEILDTPQEEIPTEEVIQNEFPEEGIRTEEVPMQEVTQEPVVEDVPPQLPQNELVPNKTEELLSQLVAQNQELKDALQPKEPEVELSEEELALQELADKLGLTEKLAKVEQLEQLLQQQEAYRQEQLQQQQLQMQEYQRIEGAKRVLSDIESKYGINEATLANKVDEMIKTGTIPQDRREDPVIWQMVSMNLNAMSKPQETPDAMTSTTSSAPMKSPAQLRREGKAVDDMDIVAGILNGM